jgi:neurofibromin 1
LKNLFLGFRHPVQSTVVRTTRVLSALLGIVAKSESHDKFRVTPTSTPYLAALVSVVEEVRTRCPIKNRLNIISSSTNTNTTNISSTVNPSPHLPLSHSITSIIDIAGSTSANVQQGVCTRQLKSWNPSYMDKTRKISGITTINSSRLLLIPPHARYYLPIDIENTIPRTVPKPTSTLVQLQQVKQVVPVIAVTPQTAPETQQTSGETNLLLDPNILTDTSTQALLLTILATLVRNTSDENEMRILYEYLSESSIVFPKVFPVIHNLLDAKINSVLSLSHDESILASVQSVIYQMIACSAGDDASQQQQQLSYLQSCGFGGLWRFAGPFTVSRQNPDNVELFVNWLEAMVETCLPSLDEHEDGSEHSGMSSGLHRNHGTRHASLHHHPFRHHHHYSASSAAACLNANLSSSMSSVSMGLKNEKN